MSTHPIHASVALHALPSILIALAGAGQALGASPFPASINPLSQNGTAGLVVNSDSVDDILIGARSPDPNAKASAGESDVVFGRPAQIWDRATGGAWTLASNWRSAAAPSLGIVRIEPRFGGIVTGPTSFVDLRSLTIDSELGLTTLDLLPGSTVIVEEAIDLTEHAAIAGFGTFATLSAIFNRGMIVMDDLTIVADDGVHNESDGDISVKAGFITGELRNHGLIDITPDTPGDPAALDVLGPIANHPDGIIALRNGLIDLTASEPLVNHGRIIFINTDAAVFAETKNPGAIELINNSTAIFFGGITSTGAITIEPGSTLAVLGAFSGAGVVGPVGPGSGGPAYLGGAFDPRGQSTIGVASFDGDLTLGNDSITTIEIGGPAPGTGHDQIIISGAFDPAGTVRIVTTSGYLPPSGAAYNVLEFTSVLGAFTAIELDAVLTVRDADASTLLIDGILRIPTAPSCAGDITGDGLVNTADFNVFATNFGSGPGATAAQGDLTGDGFVNTADFNILAGDFGCAP